MHDTVVATGDNVKVNDKNITLTEYAGYVSRGCLNLLLMRSPFKNKTPQKRIAADYIDLKSSDLSSFLF